MSRQPPSGGFDSSTIANFRREIERLIRALSPLLQAIGGNFRFLNQLFQAYVYALVAHYVHSRGVIVRPRNVIGGRFVFKLGTGGSYSSSRYSYFVLERDGRRFSLVLNINVYVGGARLNLDIALVEGDEAAVSGREDVVFFIECKSVNRASPEYLATVLGQKLLVKRWLGRDNAGRPIRHPYVDIADLLAVRGIISSGVRGLTERITGLSTGRPWTFVVDAVGNIAPRQAGVSELLRKIDELLNRI